MGLFLLPEKDILGLVLFLHFLRGKNELMQHAFRHVFMCDRYTPVKFPSLLDEGILSRLSNQPYSPQIQ